MKDEQKSVSLVSAVCELNPVGGGDSVKLSAKLNMVILNPDEKVKEVDENDEVVENYYRVKGAEVLEEARKLSNRSKFKEAQ